MFTKLKNKIKKYGRRKIYNFLEKFEDSSFTQKVFLILSIIIYIDITIFSIRNAVELSQYSYNNYIWEQKHSNVDNKLTELEEKFNKEYDLLKNKNLISFEMILNNSILKDSIQEVKLFTTPTGHVQGTFYFKYFKEMKTNSRPIRSFVEYIEPLLIDNKIVYNWGTFEEHQINKNINKNIKPTFELKEFIIIPFLTEHLFVFGILLLLFYSIYRQGGLGGDKKFQLLIPQDIKGNMKDLIGMEEIKEDILQLKDLINNREKYSKFGIAKTFNILFSGPPGTGKTKIASLLAKDLDIPMIIGTGNIETGFLAGGANTLKDLFKNARKIAKNDKSKTCLIFLDEAQVLLLKRGKSREKWGDDSANELLAQLDGVSTTKDVDIIFIAASNFDDSNMEMDEAMERRFKKKIFFRLPNKDERKNIFEFYLNKINKEVLEENINIEYISEITSRLSPAKIETIIEEAGLISIRNNTKINTDTLIKAFEKITVGETTRKTTEKQENVRKTVIYHELGHFITDFDNKIEKLKTNDLDLIKKEISLLKISSESISKYNALGYVLNSTDEVLLQTKKDLENEIISLYGGLAAEVHFLNNDNTDTDNITTGSYNDIEKISRILKHMVLELGMYSNSKINLNILNLKDDKVNIELIQKLSERLFNTALLKIKKHEELIEFLYKELEEKWVLNKEELFLKIKEYKDIKKA